MSNKDSFDIEKAKIPKDTREVLKDFDLIDNFHLKFYKFARYDISDIKKPNEKKFIFYRNKAKDLENIEIKANFGDFNFEKNINNQENMIKIMFNNYYTNNLETTYRLLIGSEQSVYETSIRLHHIYGIPYIPSTAIKGVVRSYYILENFADELKEYENRYNIFENEVLFKDEIFVNYFGSQEKEGKIIFFDAFPTTPPKIKVDIMNPHYEDYYNDNKNKIAPTDDKNPIPIPFLTVEDTEFKFFIASKEPIDENFVKLFKEALKNHGIGAKTSVGYGYLEELKWSII